VIDPVCSGVKAIVPAELLLPATTWTLVVVEVENPEALTVRICRPAGTPARVKPPLVLVVVDRERPFTETVALGIGALVLALLTVPVTDPVVGSGVKAMAPAELLLPAVT